MGDSGETGFSIQTISLWQSALRCFHRFIESMVDFGNPLVLGGNMMCCLHFFAIVGAQYDQGNACTGHCAFIFYIGSVIFSDSGWAKNHIRLLQVKVMLAFNAATTSVICANYCNRSGMGRFYASFIPSLCMAVLLIHGGWITV